MNTIEAAGILGLSERQVRRWLESKRLKGERLGRDWYVSAASVEKERLAALNGNSTKENHVDKDHKGKRRALR